MSHPIKRLCDRMARQLATVGSGATIAGAMVEANGHSAFGFSMAEATPGDMVVMAVALLRATEEATAAGALTCDGCARDFARVRAALAALQADQPVAAAKAHLH